MKVYDGNLAGIAGQGGAGRAQETANTSRVQGGKSSGSKGTEAGGDRVEFSSAMGSLSRVLETYSSDRASRVQMLAGLLQSGKYLPDSAGTSRGMVADALAAGMK